VPRPSLGFCFIGGLAVLRWGEPRLTRDIDLTILAGFGAEEAVVDRLFDRFEARIDDARPFALRNRVALLRATNGVPVDVALGALDFEQRAVQRASLWDVKDAQLLICSAEDLIVHKAFAGRDRDWLDIEGVVIRQVKNSTATWFSLSSRRWRNSRAATTPLTACRHYSTSGPGDPSQRADRFSIESQSWVPLRRCLSGVEGDGAAELVEGWDGSVSARAGSRRTWWSPPRSWQSVFENGVMWR
jgi:hypothetical protein